MKKIDILFLVHSAFIAALLCVSAFIRIPFPLVPISMQSFVVLFSGLYFGPRKTFVSFLVYLTIGLIGFPVFASGGGLVYLLKPSFGYLLGMLAAGYVIGKLVQNKPKTFHSNLIACLLGTLVIYLIGVPYYFLISKYVLSVTGDISTILYSGFLILLPGDFIKCLLASWIALKFPPLQQKKAPVS
jgi:biotin transport system substrate-specific component